MKHYILQCFCKEKNSRCKGFHLQVVVGWGIVILFPSECTSLPGTPAISDVARKKVSQTSYDDQSKKSSYEWPESNHSYYQMVRSIFSRKSYESALKEEDYSLHAWVLCVRNGNEHSESTNEKHKRVRHLLQAAWQRTERRIRDVLCSSFLFGRYRAVSTDNNFIQNQWKEGAMKVIGKLCLFGGSV